MEGNELDMLKFTTGVRLLKYPNLIPSEALDSTSEYLKDFFK